MTEPPPGAVPPHGRRVVVDEAPPRANLWAWLLATLFLAAAIVFLVLWLLERGDTKAAPNLIGLRAEAAETAAASRGFRLETVQRVSDEPAGVVLEQGPEPGAELEENAQLLAVVSGGPSEVEVPRLVGLKRSAAERLLDPLGLKLEPRVVPSNRGAGVVLAQDPAAGDRVAKGTTVKVNVSRGPALVAVPALEGLNLDRATAEILDAGLVPVVISVQSSEPEGTVIAQDPPREQKVKRGSQVRVNVSTGPAPTEPRTVTVTTVRTTTTVATVP